MSKVSSLSTRTKLPDIRSLSFPTKWNKLLLPSHVHRQVQIHQVEDGALAFRGWIRETAAEALLTRVKKSVPELLRMAQKKSFTPLELSLQVSLDISFQLREFSGSNVVGILRGQT